MPSDFNYQSFCGILVRMRRIIRMRLSALGNIYFPCQSLSSLSNFCSVLDFWIHLLVLPSICLLLAINALKLCLIIILWTLSRLYFINMVISEKSNFHQDFKHEWLRTRSSIRTDSTKVEHCRALDLKQLSALCGIFCGETQHKRAWNTLY